jgi:putative ATP-binding cassette transporter
MLIFLWRTSWPIIIAVVFFGIAGGLSSTALIALINSTLSDNLEPTTLLWGLVALSTTALLSSSLSFYLIHRLSEKTTYELRMRISRRILAVPYPYLQKLGKPGLLANLTDDIAAIANACQLLPILCINTAVVVGCMAYLSWLSWQLALILGGLILFGLLSFLLLKGRSKKFVIQAREEYDNLNRSFRALTEGIRELKLNSARREDFMKYSLGASADSYRRHSLSSLTTYLLAYQWSNLLYYLAIGLILCVFPIWPDISKEVIRDFTLVFLFMMSPLTILTNSMPVFGRASVAVDKVQKLGESLQAQMSQANTASLPAAWSTFRSLSLQNITHSFHREKENRSFTLGPINLDFKPGELVFLVGGNGSGKTTLAMLLLGLCRPESGVIRLNGKAITEDNKEAYLQNFSVVFSDFYLFDELFGLDVKNMNEQVADYLERLHLHHKVSIDNGIFSTLDLSQGQRKRLALLVAYLEDRPFYVFDEWAADQDPEFKDVFYMELLPALKAQGKTVLAITHDDRYFHIADRCIKLEEGRIKIVEYSEVDSKTDMPLRKMPNNAAKQVENAPVIP